MAMVRNWRTSKEEKPMETSQNKCQCEKSSCACAGIAVERCNCGERCACKRTCRCAPGCGCASAK